VKKRRLGAIRAASFVSGAAGSPEHGSRKSKSPVGSSPIASTIRSANCGNRYGTVEIQLHVTERKQAGLFGPFLPHLERVEKVAQFRSLATSAAAFLGSGHPLVAALRQAETDDAAADKALALLDATPTLTRRKMLSVFGAVTWPRRGP